MLLEIIGSHARKVFEYLKAAGAGVKFTTKQVQEALGFKEPGTVTGSVTGLVRKGYAERFTETEEYTTEKGEVKVREVKYFALTDEGANFDPDQEIED